MEKVSVLPSLEAGDEHIGNYQIRRALARQLRDKYWLRKDEPLANVLEEAAPVKGLVMIIFVYDLSSGQRDAKMLQGRKQEQYYAQYFGREAIKSIVDDSFNYQPVDQRPKGVFALQKKVGHFRASRAREGAGVKSGFAEFESINFTKSNIWQLQNRVASMISEIMSGPGTIIRRPMTSDIIAPSGRGVRIGSEAALKGRFMGFIDSQLYTDPKNIP